MEKYTLHPTINKSSHQFKRSYKNRCEEILIDMGFQVDDQNYEKKMHNYYDEMGKYSFQPEINLKSKRLGDESLKIRQSDGSNIHEVLYLNKFYREKQQEILNKQQHDKESYHFKPTLVSKQSDNTRTLDDILNAKDEYESHMKQYQKSIDDYMKTTMFKPKVGRANKGRSSDSKHIYNDLIKQGDKYKEDKVIKRRVQAKKYGKQAKCDTESVRLYEKKKIEILEGLFETLDVDKSNELSTDNLDIEYLSPELLDFFKPLMWEMQEHNLKMNRGEFIDYSLNLYNGMNPSDRQALFSGQKTERKPVIDYEAQFTYAPEISKKSLQLIRDIRGK